MNEYDVRRKMLLKRLDVTVQSFGWSDRAKVRDRGHFETKDEKPLFRLFLHNLEKSILTIYITIWSIKRSPSLVFIGTAVFLCQMRSKSLVPFGRTSDETLQSVEREASLGLLD